MKACLMHMLVQSISDNAKTEPGALILPDSSADRGEGRLIPFE